MVFCLILNNDIWESVPNWTHEMLFDYVSYDINLDVRVDAAVIESAACWLMIKRTRYVKVRDSCNCRRSHQFLRFCVKQQYVSIFDAPSLLNDAFLLFWLDGWISQSHHNSTFGKRRFRIMLLIEGLQLFCIAGFYRCSLTPKPSHWTYYTHRCINTRP